MKTDRQPFNAVIQANFGDLELRILAYSLKDAIFTHELNDIAKLIQFHDEKQLPCQRPQAPWRDIE